jgi:hypothetical protein
VEEHVRWAMSAVALGLEVCAMAFIAVGAIESV